RNRVSVMPSSAARAVIRLANAASSPATASARTTAASFAERTIVAAIACSTVIFSPARSPILVGGCPAARAETVSASANPSRPARIRSKVRKTVITLVSDAGYHTADGSLLPSTSPVSASTTMYDAASEDPAHASSRRADSAVRRALRHLRRLHGAVVFAVVMPGSRPTAQERNESARRGLTVQQPPVARVPGAARKKILTGPDRNRSGSPV